VARFRVGPVRVGGGRRASFTANAGPFGVTVGGGRKRRSGSTSAAERSHGQEYGPRPLTAAEIRRDEKAERERQEYELWYESLSPREREYEDQVQLENYYSTEHVFSLTNVALYCCVGIPAFFIWQLFFFFHYTFVVYLLAFFIIFKVYTKFVLPKVSSASKYFDSKPLFFYYSFLLVIVLISIFFWIKMPEFDQLLSREGESGILAFVQFSILIWMGVRRWLLHHILKQKSEWFPVFNEMRLYGAINRDTYYHVWVQWQVLLDEEDVLRSGRYFEPSVWFTQLKNSSNRDFPGKIEFEYKKFQGDFDEPNVAKSKKQKPRKRKKSQE
jgi:hypothetical protein